MLMGFFYEQPTFSASAKTLFLPQMGQKKLQRFAEIETFPNVLIYPEGMPGKWHEFFKNNNPVTLELACGKGDYTLGLARMYPDQNFIGVDLKGNRIWRGAKTAIEEPLPNAESWQRDRSHLSQRWSLSRSFGRRIKKIARPPRAKLTCINEDCDPLRLTLQERRVVVRPSHAGTGAC